MSAYVLDASAVLALLNREPGHEQVAGLLGNAAASAINLSEVASKLSDKGLDPSSIRPDLLALGLSVVPFDEALAFDAAALRSSTRHAGLSLGDRSCLATAAALGATAVTADREWGRLKSVVKISVVR